jgi:hypothetical protein
MGTRPEAQAITVTNLGDTDEVLHIELLVADGAPIQVVRLVDDDEASVGSQLPDVLHPL